MYVSNIHMGIICKDVMSVCVCKAHTNTSNSNVLGSLQPSLCWDPFSENERPVSQYPQHIHLFVQSLNFCAQCNQLPHCSGCLSTHHLCISTHCFSWGHTIATTIQWPLTTCFLASAGREKTGAEKAFILCVLKRAEVLQRLQVDGVGKWRHSLLPPLHGCRSHVPPPSLLGFLTLD